MASPWVIRPASRLDLPSLMHFLETAEYRHRHLDWRLPSDWLEHPPFWVIELTGQLRAMLAMPADPPQVAWVRIFATGSHPTPRQAWDWLFERCLAELPPRSQTALASLAFSPWFCTFLEDSGFTLNQKVITLAWDFILPTQPPLPPELIVRPMQSSDLEQVHRIDSTAFEPLWQNSLEDVVLAFQTAHYSTVAELDGRIIGYQVSTLTAQHLHLTRLAVDPTFQRLSIGSGIVYHLLQYCREESFTEMTVNTQDDNLSSQGLYRKCNFHLTGDSFPVYLYS